MNEMQVTQADRLKQLHGEIMGAARMVIDSAIEAGKILLEVKAALQHGDFETWIAGNLPFTPRTARNYMRIFRERDKIKTEIISDLTGTYKMLTAAALTKGRQDRAEAREEQAVQRVLALEVRRKEVKLGIGTERPLRAFIRTNTGRDDIEICIARGPDEENRRLETADFVVSSSFVDEVPKTTPTLDIIEHVQQMAMDGSAICTKVGWWSDCDCWMSSGGHFIDSWAVEPQRVEGVNRSGWSMTGNEHGFPTDWFCEALLHPTEQELKDKKKAAAMRELNSLYEDRENLEKKIEQLEVAERDHTTDGKDKPSLERATYRKGEAKWRARQKTRQRWATGKDHARVYDYIDGNVGVLRAAARARQKVYQQIKDLST